MRCTLTICCESGVVDQINNTLSIFNVIDDINVEQFPGVFAKLSIVFVVLREDEDEQQLEALMTVHHAGNEMVRAPLAANFGDQRRLRLISAIHGFVIPAPGVYRAAMWLDDRELGYWEFVVRQNQAPRVTASLSPSASPSPSA